MEWPTCKLDKEDVILLPTMRFHINSNMSVYRIQGTCPPHEMSARIRNILSSILLIIWAELMICSAAVLLAIYTVYPDGQHLDGHKLLSTHSSKSFHLVYIPHFSVQYSFAFFILAGNMKFSIFSTCALFLGSTLASPTETSVALVDRQDVNTLLSGALATLGDISSSTQGLGHNNTSAAQVVAELTNLVEQMNKLNNKVKPMVDNAKGKTGSKAVAQVTDVTDLSLPSIADLLQDLLSFLENAQAIVQNAIQSFAAIEAAFGQVVTDLETAFKDLGAAVGSIIDLGQNALQACANAQVGFCVTIEQTITEVEQITTTLEQLFNELGGLL